MTTNKPYYSLYQLTVYFLKLGAIGFGGPVALIGYMHKDLVEERKWILEDDYREGLTLSQLAPGPLAAQLAIYLGYVHYRVLGATLAGVAFVLPSFIMVVLLGIIYKQFGGIPWIQHVFYGISASVIGIIAISAYKLTRKSIGIDPWLWGIFSVLAIYTFVTQTENIWLFIGAGLLYMIIRSPMIKSAPKSLLFLPFVLQVPSLYTSNETLIKLFAFFAKAGAFVFGSGLAIIPFLYSGVVKENAWLNEQQFLDAVAIAMITPGPVVITVSFIGYLVAGFPGAAVAGIATFLPCYLLTILPAPYFKKYGKRPSIKAFVDGVTAAAIGAIAGAVVILARKSLFDAATIIIALVTALLIWKYKKIQEPYIILLAALTGVLIKSKLF